MKHDPNYRGPYLTLLLNQEESIFLSDCACYNAELCESLDPSFEKEMANRLQEKLDYLIENFKRNKKIAD